MIKGKLFKESIIGHELMAYQESSQSVRGPYSSALAVTDLTIGKLASIDKNGVHSSREAANAAGFRDRILHGVSTLAYAVGNAQELASWRSQITHLDGRFLSPVFIGDTIEAIVQNNDKNDHFEATVVNPQDPSKPYSKLAMAFGDRERYFAMPLAAQDRVALQYQIASMALTNTDTLRLPDGFIKVFAVQKISPEGIPAQLHTGYEAIKPILYVSAALGSEEGTIYGTQQARFMTNPFTEAGLHNPLKFAVRIKELESVQKGPKRKSTVETTVWDISYFPLNLPYLVLDGTAITFKQVH